MTIHLARDFARAWVDTLFHVQKSLRIDGLVSYKRYMVVRRAPTFITMMRSAADQANSRHMYWSEEILAVIW